jgi:hypothetical protein
LSLPKCPVHINSKGHCIVSIKAYKCQAKLNPPLKIIANCFWSVHSGYTVTRKSLNLKTSIWLGVPNVGRERERERERERKREGQKCFIQRIAQLTFLKVAFWPRYPFAAVKLSGSEGEKSQPALPLPPASPKKKRGWASVGGDGVSRPGSGSVPVIFLTGHETRTGES